MGESFQLHGTCVSEGKIMNGRACHRAGTWLQIEKFLKTTNEKKNPNSQ